MSNLKEHDFPFESFITGVYISEKICDDLIDYFKENHIDAAPGTVGGNEGAIINPDIKDSMDLHVTPHEDNAIVTEYVSALQSALSVYQEKYKMLTRMSRFTLTNNWNIQYYKQQNVTK